jgi:putative oxidoreductase
MNRSTRLAVLSALWLVTILEAIAMGLAGSSKFTGGRWQGLFAGWGYPVWFSYVVGTLEIGGALCLLVPGIAVRAALMLSLIMIGATVTLLTHPGPMGWMTPVIHLLILIGIATARYKSRELLDSTR